MLDREQQQLFQSFYRQHVPQSLKEYHRSNINLLQEQSCLLREKEEHILSQPTIKVGRPVKRKISSSSNTISTSTTIGAASDNNNAICTTAGSDTACSATIMNKNTCTDANINTGTTATSTSTTPSPALKKLPLCYCWANDGGTERHHAQIVDELFLQRMLESVGDGGGSSPTTIAIKWSTNGETCRVAITSIVSFIDDNSGNNNNNTNNPSSTIGICSSSRRRTPSAIVLANTGVATATYCYCYCYCYCYSKYEY